MSRPIRVYQEDWFPFQNLPKALARFSAQTGVPTTLSWDSVGVGTIETMFEHMTRSFTEDDPPFDLICLDEIMLQAFAHDGRVMCLDAPMAAAGIDLRDVTAETRRAVTVGGRVYGLPCVNVSSSLLYRRDLYQRYDLPVPQSWSDLRATAAELQNAVRRDTGREDFYGFETRGAAGGGHAVWSVGSFIASFGARWLDDESRPEPISDAHRAALEAYAGILRDVCPPDQGSISFVEMRRDFAAGRVGMIMDVGMEYAHVLARNPELAEKSAVALVPAGPCGRHPNLYSPAWAIPAASPVKDEAFALASFLTSRTQLIEDAMVSNAVEVSSLSALYDPAFDRHFRRDLLNVVRANRAIAFEERPFGPLGIDACAIVGNAAHDVVVGNATVDAALARIHAELLSLAETRLGARSR
jgi:ABC-type glycerol-3-phosphate transport system substrate-binding protein